MSHSGWTSCMAGGGCQECFLEEGHSAQRDGQGVPGGQRAKPKAQKPERCPHRWQCSPCGRRRGQAGRGSGVGLADAPRSRDSIPQVTGSYRESQVEGDEVSQESVLMEKEGQRRCKEIRAEATSARALGSPAASSFLWTQEGALSLLLRGNSFAANQGVFGETYSR